MSNYDQTASKLKLMGHPARLQILDMLRDGEMCVCHIEQALNKRQAYISQQLMALRDSGVVVARKEGLQVYYRILDEDVIQLLSVLHGAPDGSGLERLEGCSCPTCATIPMMEIK